ncbi:tetraspanin-8-like [Hevea brasiliensis]|uniref:tetraspanin-8-like n=1 Tax=Hevea brasiliensis TaxID=3981 RepID=UPI0025CECCA5|nr:tetraspanin-8-like [Hevea brasiliensis]
MSNKSKKIAISFINTLSLLFGFAAFFSWVYFGLRMGSWHRPLHPNPIIDLGLFLLGISLVKHILCWCFPGIKKLVTYLASFPMLAIIITTFVVMIFALVVTHKGNGREIPRVSYSKPDLEDYSKSLRRYVEGITRWPPIIRALRDSPICTNYTEDYDHLNHSVRKNVNLTPLQTGCCARVHPSCYHKPDSRRKHCLPDHYHESICVFCDSCRAAILENMKMEWRHMVFANSFIFVSLIIVYSFCYCTRKENTSHLLPKYFKIETPYYN